MKAPEEFQNRADAIIITCESAQAEFVLRRPTIEEYRAFKRNKGASEEISLLATERLVQACLLWPTWPVFLKDFIENGYPALIDSLGEQLERRCGNVLVDVTPVGAKTLSLLCEDAGVTFEAKKAPYAVFKMFQRRANSELISDRQDAFEFVTGQCLISPSQADFKIMTENGFPWLLRSIGREVIIASGGRTDVQKKIALTNA